MSARFGEMNTTMNARFSDMNERFNDMNTRFDDLSRLDTRIGDVTKRMDNSMIPFAHISEQPSTSPRGFNRCLRLRVGNRNSLLRSPVQTILPPSDPPAP